MVNKKIFLFVFALSLLFLAVLSISSVYAKTTTIDSGFSIGQCIYPISDSSGQWMGSDSCSFNGEYYCELYHGSSFDEAILHNAYLSFTNDAPVENPLDDSLDNGTLIYGGCAMISEVAPCCPNNFMCVDAAGNPLSGTAFSTGVIGDVCELRGPGDECANQTTQEDCATYQCIWENNSCHDPSEYKQCGDYKTSPVCINDPANVGPSAFDECGKIDAHGNLIASCRCSWVNNVCVVNKTVFGKGECYLTYDENSKCDLNTGLQTISWTTEWNGNPPGSTSGNESCVNDSKQFYCGGVSAILSFATTLTIIIAVILIIIFYLILIKSKRKPAKKKNQGSSKTKVFDGSKT